MDQSGILGSQDPKICDGPQCLNSAKRGVSQGYAVSLELIGLGYTAEISAQSSASEPNTRAKQRGLGLEQLVGGKPAASRREGGVFLERARHMILNLGKSHRIFHFVGSGAADLVCIRGRDNSMTILIFGISRSIVGQTAAEISRYKKPDIYNAKGINDARNSSVTRPSH